MTPAGHAAAHLFRARRQQPRALLERLPAAHPTTLADGIAAQVALAELMGAERPAGFKIGATAQRMQAFLGLAGPAAGFMRDDDLHGDGSTLDWTRFFRPGVECELAVHLGRALPPGPCSPAEAEAAVSAIMPAIEIVENRYADLQAFGAPAMVADGIFHAAAVLGAPVTAWGGLDLLGLQGDFVIDGAVRDSGFGRDLLGGPWSALAWLAASPEVAAFGGLQEGQIVMLGSVCPPIWLDGPALVKAQFGPLGTACVHLVTTSPG